MSGRDGGWSWDHGLNAGRASWIKDNLERGVDGRISLPSDGTEPAMVAGMKMPAFCVRQRLLLYGTPTSVTGAFQTVHFDIERRQTIEEHGFATIQPRRSSLSGIFHNGIQAARRCVRSPVYPTLRSPARLACRV